MTSREEALRRTTKNVMECAVENFACDEFFRTVGFAGFAYKEISRLQTNRNFSVSVHDVNVRLLTEKLMLFYDIKYYGTFDSRQHFFDEFVRAELKVAQDKEQLVQALTDYVDIEDFIDNDLADYHVFSGLSLPSFIQGLPQIIRPSWYAVYVVRVPWLGRYKEEGVFDE